jgi:hypothetical protein
LGADIVAEIDWKIDWKGRYKYLQRAVKKYYKALHALGRTDKPDQKMYDEYRKCDHSLQLISKYKRSRKEYADKD